MGLIVLFFLVRNIKMYAHLNFGFMKIDYKLVASGLTENNENLV